MSPTMAHTRARYRVPAEESTVLADTVVGDSVLAEVAGGYVATEDPEDVANVESVGMLAMLCGVAVAVACAVAIVAVARAPSHVHAPLPQSSEYSAV